MKKLLTIVTIFFVLAFSVNAAESSITNEKAIEKLHEFFGLLDIQVYDKENLSKIVTPDFRIFEVGNDFNLDSFDSFIDGAAETLSETKWVLSNFVVSIDNKSVHISYFNKGSFKTKQNELIRYDWMESVYMVLDGEELKLKFLQSDVVSEVTEQLGQ
jgi:hypothetical protein